MVLSMTEVNHQITRSIEIDAGHRLPFHGSKCKNIHGHRYKIEARCSGKLIESGEQDGMILDFGFLKEEMEEVIDSKCDHGFIFCYYDEICINMLLDDDKKDLLIEGVKQNGHWSGISKNEQKIYILDSAPTAENLAKHWFDLLKPKIKNRSNNMAFLVDITVWETPNCKARYGE